jgi:competence protein ComEA
MLKNMLLACAAVFLSMSVAWAEVDVNKADQAALDGIKGVGPAMSAAILEERKKGGNFKDWDDLQKRVKGIGEKNSEKLSEAGLTVNGVTRSGAAKPAARKVAAKPAAKGKADK